MPYFHAGAAQIDITPPMGMDMTGYIARERRRDRHT